MSFAYLDAGTGSLMLQAVLGGIAGVAVAWKAWRNKVMLRKAERAADRTRSQEEIRTHP